MCRSDVQPLKTQTIECGFGVRQCLVRGKIPFVSIGVGSFPFVSVYVWASSLCSDISTYIHHVAWHTVWSTYPVCKHGYDSADNGLRHVLLEIYGNVDIVLLTEVHKTKILYFVWISTFD